MRALERAEEMGADAMQVHTQSPRMWRPSAYGEADFGAFADALSRARSVKATFCHATYLVNLATSDPVLLEKSRRSLVDNLLAAAGARAEGLVLHVGSHRGAGFDAAVGQAAAELLSALDEAEQEVAPGHRMPRLLLENTAGAGGTMGRSFAELAAIISAAGSDRRLGACVDTQHLFASGVGFASLEEADAVVSSFDRSVGLERLGCLHLNDSLVPCGGNRDRHANLGEGFIGRRALGSILSHPDLQRVPAILEVPGVDRQGTDRLELEKARAFRRAGLRRRRAATRRLPPAPRRATDARTGSRPDR